MRELLSQLASHSLDFVLSNESAPRDTAAGWISRRIAHQPVSLVSRPIKGRRSKTSTLKFPDDLEGQELILPSQDSAVRLAFDLIDKQVFGGKEIEKLKEVNFVGAKR